ncbi:MAG: glycosyltransferase family 2 protein [Bacteroidaceae bacterium]|nr:glycosyltransferase family 2 protein [Bacteroidaceae bacterium]
MKLSIIIVNYNVKRFLYQCLQSVESAINAPGSNLAGNADIWVVDNASHDGSIDFLSQHFPRVHFVRNEENVGFSKANNKAIEFSEGEYVLLLNPDTIVSTDAICKSVQWMEEHEEAGAVGVALHSAKGAFAWESRRGVPTPLVSFCKISGLNKIFPNHHVIGRYYMRFLDRNKASKIEILSGAYMMLRRKAIEQVGVLDEDFFMYGEDVDLSYRLLKGGWKNYYLPHPIIHYKGESEHPSTIRYVNVFHQAMIIFYGKHFSKRYFLSGLLIRLAVYFKAFLTLLKHFVGWILSAFPKKKFTPHYYCYCDEGHRQELKRLAQEQEATITFMERGQVPVAVTTRDAFYLFDTTCYGFDEILNVVIRNHSQMPHMALATFSPEIGILLP